MASIATASPYNNTLKRRSASPLDCQSLQSSLKRVRLSCSPGELRLQRDVRSLASYHGWEMMAADRWHHCASHAQLFQQDPLRLKLQLPNHASMWIQIPRMYPHRPPVISRLEGDLWMERIVVQESPPASSVVPASGMNNDGPAPTSPSVCGLTVVYNEWSPILHIGNLLDFLIQWGLSQRPTVMEQNPHVPSNCMMMSDNDDHYPHIATSGHSGRPGFVEEHKMEDRTSLNTSLRRRQQQRHLHPSSGTTLRYGSSTTADGPFSLRCLAPNRFDVGYGKYEDPLSTLSRNAMEF